jgi:hypothetical protein
MQTTKTDLGTSMVDDFYSSNPIVARPTSEDIDLQKEYMNAAMGLLFDEIFRLNDLVRDGITDTENPVVYQAIATAYHNVFLTGLKSISAKTKDPT